MKTSDLVQDLNLLLECEIVRFQKEEDRLTLLVVGDNEEEEHHHDEEEEENSHSCCDGLNGHLFSLLFEGVKDYVFDGNECDNYRTLEVKDDYDHLHIRLLGSNFDSDEEEVTVDFAYETYTVEDEGEIEGPDA